MVSRSPSASASALGALAASLRSAPLLASAALGLVLGDLTAGDHEILPAALLAAGAGAASLLLFLADPLWRRIAIAVLAFALGRTNADRVYRPEVAKMGYDEALMLDTEGYVSEASGENIFMVKNGTLKTTPLTSVLPGITRDSVIQIAKAKRIRLLEERFTRDELYTAQEAFFTGTAAELTPIREIDNRAVGKGKPGPVTRELQAAFFDIVRGNNSEYGEWLDYL